MLRLARRFQKSHGGILFYFLFYFLSLPLISKRVYSEFMLHGDYVSVKCRFKDSQSIVDSNSYIIHKNNTLEINVARPLNSGKYTCIASNSLGNKENHVYLEVKGE